MHIIHYMTGNTLTAESGANPWQDLRYSARAPGAAFLSTTLAGPGLVGEEPAMALDRSGVVHYAYSNRNESATKANWTVDYGRLCP